MCLPVGKKAKHIQENFGAFLKIGGRSVLFFITWERKLHISKKDFGAFLKIVGHSVLFFITMGKTAKHTQEKTSEHF